MNKISLKQFLLFALLTVIFVSSTIAVPAAMDQNATQETADAWRKTLDFLKNNV